MTIHASIFLTQHTTVEQAVHSYARDRSLAPEVERIPVAHPEVELFVFVRVTRGMLPKLVSRDRTCVTNLCCDKKHKNASGKRL